jgi:hypothetical protein
MNTAKVDIILAAGGTVTPEYVRLTERLELFTEVGTDNASRLIAAVTGNATAEEMLELHSLAIGVAASTSIHRATVRNAVLETINRSLVEEYAKTAHANFGTLRQLFNKHAKNYTAAHTIVPATTNAAELVTASDKVRNAWAQAQTLGPTMNNLVPLLITAAELAGIRFTHPNQPIALVADVTGLHRRRAWEAYAQGWTALLELGATLTVCALEEYEDYAEPAPMETRQEWMGIGFRNLDHDPEDHTATDTRAAKKDTKHEQQTR